MEIGMNEEIKLSLTETEVAWLAGLLEGEGCFYFNPRKKNPDTKIQLSMTDKDIVERVAKMFSTTIATLLPDPRDIHHLRTKNYYRTYICGVKVRAAMRAIRPFMGRRRTAAIDRQFQAWESRGGRDNSELHINAVYPLNYPANYLRRNRLAV
jgi:hypothetical protein